MGNPDIFIFGYVHTIPGTSVEIVYCPQCYSAWFEEHNPSYKVLRTEDMYNYPHGVKCCKCEDYIFLPQHPHTVDRLDVFRTYIETLEF